MTAQWGFKVGKAGMADAHFGCADRSRLPKRFRAGGANADRNAAQSAVLAKRQTRGYSHEVISER